MLSDEDEPYPFTAPTSTIVSENLLFFDTFSHSGSEKLNFDLVQFPSPVVIDLIKIVPLGQPIEAKIPGNVRLGATNPSNCELEFFINDLSKQDAHTMADLGKFYCSEKATDFNPPLQIQTDGLLLRGSYRTLTLAIFGQIATYDDKIDEDQPILSAASPPAQTPASPVVSDRDSGYLVKNDDQVVELIGDTIEGSESTLKSRDDLLGKGSPMIDNGDIIENDAIPQHSQFIEPPYRDRAVVLDDLTSNDGDTSASSFLHRSSKIVDEDYASTPNLDSNNKQRLPITQKSKTNSIESSSAQPLEKLNNNDGDEGISDDFREDFKEWSLDVENYSPKPLTYFADPSLTLQERNLTRKFDPKRRPSSKYISSVERQISKVKQMFESVLMDTNQNNSISDEWVVLVEDLYNDIANLSLVDTIDHEEMLEFLVEQINLGLNFKLALRQKQTGFKVRHLRAGIKLATILFHCGDPAVRALLNASIPHKVLSLYDQDQMSLPLRLLIFKCLSVACDNVLGVEHIITHKEHLHVGSAFTIAEVRKQISLRTKSPFEEFKSEANLEADAQVNSIASSEVQDVKPLISEIDLKNQTSEPLTCYQIMILMLLSKQTTRVTIAIGNLIKKIRLYKDLANLKAICLRPPASTSSTAELDEESSSIEYGSLRLSNSVFETVHKIIQDITHLLKDAHSNIVQPVRYLPAHVQFQVKPNPHNPYLAIYRWMKYYGTLDLINSILTHERHSAQAHDGLSNIELDQSIKLKASCLTFVQLILDSPNGTQLLMSADFIGASDKLLSKLRDKQESKRPAHLRMSVDIENGMSGSLLREESLFASRRFDFALRLTYNLKVTSCIDKLFKFHRQALGKTQDSTSESTCDPEKVLHQLYIISDHPYGLDAIVKHFSCIGNLDCLLRFLDMPDHHNRLEFVKETSIDYALELIGTFLRLNDNVLAIADEYLETFTNLCKTKDKNLSVRLKSLLPWVSSFDASQPIPTVGYCEESFKDLMRVIRKSIPNYSIPFARGLDFELPPQMITAVKILRQLCIPPQVESFIEANFDTYSLKHSSNNPNQLKTSHSFIGFVDGLPHQQNQNQSWNLNFQLTTRNQNSNYLGDDSIIEQLGQTNTSFKLFQPYEESICGELKYHYGIMQVFEQEGLKRLLNTLRELVGNYPHPTHQSAALSGLRGRIVISYIHSVIILIESIIFHLIDARGSEFQDTSVIPVILETYSLLCFVPKPDTCRSESRELVNHHTDLVALQRDVTIKVANYQLAQKIKKLILSILMSYTQMCLSVSDSEEKFISKSMWTRMLKEVMDFTLSTPVFFNHGLDVLTKILPSPLPSSSMMDSIDQEQLFKNINHRKLWSAHLHPLHQHIEQMISSLSICYQSDIRQMIYYFCNQLCDLSSNAACLVAKIITGALIGYAARLVQEATGQNQQSTICNNTNNGCANNNKNSGSPSGQQQDSGQKLLASSTASGSDPAGSTANNSADDRLTASAINSHIASSSVGLIQGPKEWSYAAKVLLNLLSSLITNQAFETALTNHLQMIGKKDEKLLANLQNTLKLQEDYRPGDGPVEEQLLQSTSGNASNLSIVTHLIEAIKAIGSDSMNKEVFAEPSTDSAPPDELTRINLVELARKTSDRFSISSSLKQTYRLKVLLDLNSRKTRSTEAAVPSAPAGTSAIASSSSSSSKRFEVPYSYQEHPTASHKQPYPVSRSNRRSNRSDSFRTRSQNTSRPPSIHVDEFIDLYGDKSASAGRYQAAGPPASKTSSSDYHRSSSMSRNNYMAPDQHATIGESASGRQSSYFSPPPSKSSSGGGGSSRRK